MFGIFKEIAGAVGTITGTIIGVPVALVAEALEIPKAIVKEAKEAGCETYEEIRKFFDVNY